MNRCKKTDVNISRLLGRLFRWCYVVLCFAASDFFLMAFCDHVFPSSLSLSSCNLTWWLKMPRLISPRFVF